MDISKGTPLENDGTVCSKKVAYKNVIIIGLVSLLNYSAISPTNTLMTSTAGKTLGNITYGMNYTSTCLFTFLAVSLLNNFKSRKKLLLFGVLCIVGVMACNWYTSYYTLLPGTLLFGVGVPTVWMTSLVYVKEIAVYYTRNSTQKDTNIASYFTGIIIAFSVVGYLVGNATIAGVLTLLKDQVGNNSIATNNFTKLTMECHTNDDALEFNFVTTNVLRGIIVLYPLSAFGIAVLFLDNLTKQQDKIFPGLNLITRAVKEIRLSAVSIAKLSMRKEILLTCPLFFTSGMSIGFIFSRYTKVSRLCSCVIMCLYIILVATSENFFLKKMS